MRSLPKITSLIYSEKYQGTLLVCYPVEKYPKKSQVSGWTYNLTSLSKMDLLFPEILLLGKVSQVKKTGLKPMTVTTLSPV